MDKLNMLKKKLSVTWKSGVIDNEENTPLLIKKKKSDNVIIPSSYTSTRYKTSNKHEKIPIAWGDKKNVDKKNVDKKNVDKKNVDKPPHIFVRSTRKIFPEEYMKFPHH